MKAYNIFGLIIGVGCALFGVFILAPQPVGLAAAAGWFMLIAGVLAIITAIVQLKNTY